MKSEHRHELKTNELERIASEWGHTAEHYVQDNWMLLAVAVVAIAIGAGGLVYWRSSSGVAGQQGWREFASANKASDFGNIADKFPGTAAGSWARLMEGEIELSSGVRSSFTDRAAGRSDLKKAQENFEKLIADKATPSDVMERALFGLARAKEALPDKNLGPSKIDDAAIEIYQRLLTEFPITIYKDYAESRIAALKTGTAQDFYAWFEQQNPKPADREMPKDSDSALAGRNQDRDRHACENRAAARQIRFTKSRHEGRALCDKSREAKRTGKLGQAPGQLEQEAGYRRGARVSGSLFAAGEMSPAQSGSE